MSGVDLIYEAVEVPGYGRYELVKTQRQIPGKGGFDYGILDWGGDMVFRSSSHISKMLAIEIVYALDAARKHGMQAGRRAMQLEIRTLLGVEEAFQAFHEHLRENGI